MGDVDDRTDAVITAGKAALTAVRALPGSLDRADAANRLARELRKIGDQAAAVAHAEVLRAHDSERLSFGQLAQRFGISKTLAHKIVRSRDTLPPEEEETVLEPATLPEPSPVVAALVTSHRGVLVARRNDGKPPWTFIAGKIESGESPAAAAVREVEEETGLHVRAGGIIGRRVHPQTGRTMVYMAARPTDGTDAYVADADELAEVRWVGLAEALELMGDMYEPAHQHLRRWLETGTEKPG
jgi:8-oxo-dGTP pyrophosphatase MutT (NUDIX family)